MSETVLPAPARAGQPDTAPKRYRAIFYRALAIYIPILALAANLVWPTPRWDVYEMIGASREWVIGNFRGDISSAWVARIFSGPFGGAPFAIYIAAAACAAGTIWCVWRLAGEYLDPKRACWAALLLGTYYYTNIGGIYFNRNVVHSLFWYISILIFYRTLKENKLLWWAALGGSMGFALLSHYPAVFLGGAMAVYALATPHRRVFKTPGPYLAVAIALGMFAPHLLFIHEHYDYIKGYINSKQPKDGFFFRMLTGWGAQLAMAAPMLISLLPLLILKKGGKEKSPCQETAQDAPLRNFPLAMFLLPIPFLLAAQLITGVAFKMQSYGFQLWQLVPLCLLYYFPARESAEAWKKSITLGVIFAVSLLAALLIQTAAGYFFPGKNLAQHLRPARALSRQIDELWSAEYPDRPCSFVGGEEQCRFLYGDFSRFRPQIDSFQYAAWSVEKTKSQGGVVVWRPVDAPDGERQMPEELAERFPTARFVGQVTAPYITFPGKATETWNVAFFPPEENQGVPQK